MLQHDDPLASSSKSGGLGQTYLIMEYLENGTLTQLLERMAGQLLPNRLLWSLFLCITRAYVAMAYPLQVSENGEPQQEVLLNQAPSALAHNDMHGRNLMFGPRRPHQLEHSIVPSLKLIDLGSAREVTGGINPRPSDVQDFDEVLNLTKPSVNQEDVRSGLSTPYALMRNRELDAELRNRGVVFNIQYMGIVSRVIAA
ncbi:hypothetical protein BJ170DRAFT_86746 [Xylariales sp. AK1849]|nr:hypothetical protein BJ170DRAFT_86746 [Xylariales sp. AK1849]